MRWRHVRGIRQLIVQSSRLIYFLELVANNLRYKRTSFSGQASSGPR